jgi:hypothetical protein
MTPNTAIALMVASLVSDLESILRPLDQEECPRFLMSAMGGKRTLTAALEADPVCHVCEANCSIPSEAQIIPDGVPR